MNNYKDDNRIGNYYNVKILIILKRQQESS